ncbi:autolysin, partial [Staphylococcus aureus]
EFIEWLNTSEGKQFHVDLWSGFQCLDYATAGWYDLFGLLLRGLGAQDIPFANNFAGLATVYPKTPDYLEKHGHLDVFVSNYGAGYG